MNLTHAMSSSLIPAAFALGGLLAGGLHLLSLRWNTHLFLEGAALRGMGLQLLRLGLLGLLLALAARHGAPALLACAGAVLLARRLARHWLAPSGGTETPCR